MIILTGGQVHYIGTHCLQEDAEQSEDRAIQYVHSRQTWGGLCIPTVQLVGAFALAQSTMVPLLTDETMITYGHKAYDRAVKLVLGDDHVQAAFNALVPLRAGSTAAEVLHVVNH